MIGDNGLRAARFKLRVEVKSEIANISAAG